MLDDIFDFKVDRTSLIGRPRLSLKGQKCGNIACNKDDQFKLLEGENYICECGYRLSGKFEETKHKMKFGCSAKECPLLKTKMDKGCLTCKYITER